MINHASIKEGLRNGEFFLEYLPTVSLKSNRCVGAEALIRWRRMSRVVPPLEFIPLVENSPLSSALTYWVIDTVAAQFGAWMRQHEGVHISINIPHELWEQGGMEYAAKKSDLLGVAGKLVFEVTERGVPGSLSINTLHRSDDSTMLVALDDVTLNDANLHLLALINVDFIKLDKSVVDQMLCSDWSPEKIAQLSDLMHTGSFKVIAEGVESAKQVAILKEAGIDMAQGWYFSRPLSVENFKAYFSAHQ